MQGFAGLAPAYATRTATAVAILPPSFSCGTRKRKIGRLRAKLHEKDDPLFQSAVKAAALRFQETNRAEPLFVDPYSACFLPSNIKMDVGNYPHHYCLATKFIDEKLLRTMNSSSELKQVVLLTDGMDTRPYRLSWPTSTIMFDVSPETVFRRAYKMLEGSGAKISRSCLLLHVPLESADIEKSLRNKGFNGNRKSIWIFQGLPVVNLASFEEMLLVVRSLAIKGCLLLGELPYWFAETEIGIKASRERWMENLFARNDFRVQVIGYSSVARSLSKRPPLGEYKNTLFVAEHLRLSDDQMETWRREFQRVEEAGDEEGFEEL